MSLSQIARSLAVSTPLGEDVLLLRSMRGSERLSTLFTYELELISEDVDIMHQDLLGQPVTVRLDLPDYRTRYFNGIVSRFSHTGFDGSMAIYGATLVPWLWLLTRTADCRIFQEQTVPDIVKEIFREHGYTDFEEYLATELYRPWSYCVQYRETDFNFINRLMEQEGIYYYFKHENGKHTLVLADSYSAHDTIAGYEEIPYYPPSETTLRERDHIDDWSIAGAVQPGVFAHTDFDYTAPRKKLLAERLHPHEHARADLEIYDYPGGYTKRDQGEDWVRARIEELHVDYETAQGAGNARGLSTGALFTLTGYPRRDQNREYLILSTDYQLQSDLFGSSSAGGTGPVFQCSFTALDAQTPYRPPRTTPKSLVQGPQTAIVVGKSGEEIWTDKYGRVKVQFHWDRYSKSDEKSSCWVRVSHPWAGKGWGAVAIPRIGQEVIVDFLEGDPDRPIITGRVYNDVNKPPYGLPDNATVSTIKTNSSKGGGGFNEIRMEDKKGSEQLFIHAEKNQDVRVKNDTFEWIGNERHLIVKTDQLEQVEGDKHVTVKGDRNEKVSGSVSLDTGMDLQQKVGMKHGVDAGMEIHLKGGMNVVIEAGMSITLKAGGGFVVVGPAGVTLSGTPVLVNSGGAAGSGSGCSPDAPKPPKEAVTAKPGGIADVVSGSFQHPQARTLANAAKGEIPFCEKCEAMRYAKHPGSAQNGKRVGGIVEDDHGKALGKIWGAGKEAMLYAQHPGLVQNSGQMAGIVEKSLEKIQEAGKIAREKIIDKVVDICSEKIHGVVEKLGEHLKKKLPKIAEAIDKGAKFVHDKIDEGAKKLKEFLKEKRDKEIDKGVKIYQDEIHESVEKFKEHVEKSLDEEADPTIGKATEIAHGEIDEEVEKLKDRLKKSLDQVKVDPIV